MARDWSQHNPWHLALVDHCICIMASLFSHICVRRHTTNCLWTVWCQVTYYIMQQELLNSVQVGGCLPAPDAATHDLLAAAVTSRSPAFRLHPILYTHYHGTERYPAITTVPCCSTNGPSHNGDFTGSGWIASQSTSLQTWSQRNTWYILTM